MQIGNDIFCAPCTDHGIEVKTRRWSPIEIVEKVCEYHKADLKKIIGKERYRLYVDIRHICMHILYNDGFLRMSKKSIGQLFNRDHSTVIHAIRNVEDICFSNPQFKERVKDVYFYVYDTLKYYNL